MNTQSSILILALALCVILPCRAEDPPAEPTAAPTPAVPKKPAAAPTPAVPKKPTATPTPAVPKKKPAPVKKPTTPPSAFPGHTPLFGWLMTNHDANHDRKLDPAERLTVKKAFEEKDFMAGKLDVNANNQIDVDEIDRLVSEPVAVPVPAKKRAPKKPAPKKK